MNHQELQTTADSALPRLGIAIGFAMLASAAIVFNVAAAASPSAPVAMPAATESTFAYQWTEAVDWERVAPSRITPAETVGAYER